MKTKTVSATEAKNRFGQVLKQVSLTGGPIVVERDGKAVAVILSLQEYERLHGRKRLAAEESAPLANAFGMWANRNDIDDDWLENGRSRWLSDWRDE